MNEYAFVNQNGKTAYISDVSLAFKGTWTPNGTYSPPIEAVDYNNGKFIVLVQNYNTPPLGSSSWSELITVGTISSTDPVQIAQTALDQANATMAIAVSGSNLAEQALAAQYGPTFTGYFQVVNGSSTYYVAANYTNGQLTSLDPYANILVFASPSATKTILNPVGGVSGPAGTWSSCTGHNLINITDLGITGVQVLTLTIAGAPLLTTLGCTGASLTNLSVSGTSLLNSLNLQNNHLPSLDLSNLAGVTQLLVNYNLLTSLNICPLTLLASLKCDHNSLTSLDMSANTLLTAVTCNNNSLTSLNTSALALMYSLICSYNNITSLDTSNNTELLNLECSNNALTSLNLSGCTALNMLDCSSNALTGFVLPLAPGLTTVNCSNNALTQAAVDALLLVLVTAGAANGTLDISGGTNAAPSSPTGQGYVTALQNSGWGVTTN